MEQGIGGSQRTAAHGLGIDRGDDIVGRYAGPDGKPLEIRNVWAHNLDAEMAAIRQVVEKYPYVAMDTEFPGVVARPIVDYTQSDYQYQTLRCNVDLLKIIQLGLSFANEEGEFAEGCCCWQFNFKFSLTEDMYAQDSIDLLKQSDIQFEKHANQGIDVHEFGELLMTSGLVLVDHVKWISFHSGYDFGYLIKLLTSQALPPTEGEFFELLKAYFPCLFDIKFVMMSLENFHGGLNKLGDELKVERIGQMHQAGSDSLLTAQVFFKMMKASFGGLSCTEMEKFKGDLYGYGTNAYGRRTGKHNGYNGNGNGDGGAAGAGAGGAGYQNGPTGAAGAPGPLPPEEGALPDDDADAPINF